jgi:uncharacterized protein (TIGR02118 family)
MQTKITFIYDNPLDPSLFEQEFAAQLTAAKAMPGLRTLEVSKVWPKEDGSATPAYRLLDLYFDDYEAASAAVETDEAAGLFESVFASATGGVRIVFAAVEERSDRARSPELADHLSR